MPPLLLTSAREQPSYHQGFARVAGESEAEGWQTQASALYAPHLGPTGLVVPDWSGWRQPSAVLTNLTPAVGYKLDPELGYVIDFPAAANDEHLLVTGPDFGNPKVFSMMAVCKFSALSTDLSIIMSRGGTGVNELLDFFILTSTSKMNVAWNDEANISANTALSANTPYLLGMTFNVGAVEFWLNGVSDGTGSINDNTMGTDRLAVGIWGEDSASFEWQGVISQIRMYPWVLTPLQWLAIAHDFRRVLRRRQQMFSREAAGAASIAVLRRRIEAMAH